MKKFGTMIAELRREAGMKQSQFAAQISKMGHEIAGATISAIETREEFISEEAGYAIIAALNPNDETRAALLTALERHRNECVIPTKYEFGRVLNGVFDRYHITKAWIADKLGKSRQIIHFWSSGAQLPSGEMMPLIIGALRGAGAPDGALIELVRSHITDSLLDYSKLSYLNKAQLAKLAEAGASLLLDVQPGAQPGVASKASEALPETGQTLPHRIPALKSA